MTDTPSGAEVGQVNTKDSWLSALGEQTVVKLTGPDFNYGEGKKDQKSVCFDLKTEQGLNDLEELVNSYAYDAIIEEDAQESLKKIFSVLPEGWGYEELKEVVEKQKENSSKPKRGSEAVGGYLTEAVRGTRADLMPGLVDYRNYQVLDTNGLAEAMIDELSKKEGGPFLQDDRSGETLANVEEKFGKEVADKVYKSFRKRIETIAKERNKPVD